MKERDIIKLLISWGNEHFGCRNYYVVYNKEKRLFYSVSEDGLDVPLIKRVNNKTIKWFSFSRSIMIKVNRFYRNE